MGFDASRYAREISGIRDANKMLEQYRNSVTPAVPIHIPKVEFPMAGVAAAARSISTAARLSEAVKAENRYPVSSMIPRGIIKSFPLNQKWAAVPTSGLRSAMALDLSFRLRTINSQMLASRELVRKHRGWSDALERAGSLTRSVAAPSRDFSFLTRMSGVQSFYGLSGSLRVMSSYRARETAAFTAAFKASTLYGPIVVTPEEPAPQEPPTRERMPPAEDLMPDTTTRTGEEGLSLEWWQDAMTFAKSVAQHHRTRVVVRFVGRKAVQITVLAGKGAVTGASGRVAWEAVSYFLMG